MWCSDPVTVLVPGRVGKVDARCRPAAGGGVRAYGSVGGANRRPAGEATQRSEPGSHGRCSRAAKLVRYEATSPYRSVPDVCDGRRRRCGGDDDDEGRRSAAARRGRSRTRRRRRRRRRVRSRRVLGGRVLGRSHARSPCTRSRRSRGWRREYDDARASTWAHLPQRQQAAAAAAAAAVAAASGNSDSSSSCCSWTLVAHHHLRVMVEWTLCTRTLFSCRQHAASQTV